MQQTLTAKLQIFPKPSDRQLLFDTSKAQIMYMRTIHP